MNYLHVYSSVPLSNAKLACVFLNLKAQGMQVVHRPLAELPAAGSVPRPRSLSLLEEELYAVSLRLVGIGDQLNDHETGRCRLDAGVEQGLRFDREALQRRQLGLQAQLKGQKGGKLGS